MKTYLLFIATIFTTLALINSCKKDNEYMSEAIITGYDERMCPCCGGLMITFNGEKRPYSGEFKLIENSADIDIKSNETFPVYVEVNWTTEPNKCLGNYIKITRLKRK